MNQKMKKTLKYNKNIKSCKNYIKEQTKLSKFLKKKLNTALTSITFKQKIVF